MFSSLKARYLAGFITKLQLEMFLEKKAITSEEYELILKAKAK